MGKKAVGPQRSHGGRRPGAGRKKKNMRVTQIGCRTPKQVRTLLGLDRPEFKTETWDASNPVTFLTVATVAFFLTRHLMDSHKEAAIDWEAAASAHKWPIQAAESKWPQVAASGRKWPLSPKSKTTLKATPLKNTFQFCSSHQRHTIS